MVHTTKTIGETPMVATETVALPIQNGMVSAKSQRSPETRGKDVS